MELKIDIDMNKIDYNAINKQIQEKVKELDISARYEIDNKIESRVSKYVDEDISSYIHQNWYYSDKLSDNAKSSITKLATDKINDKVTGVVAEIFEKMTDEELDEIIVDLVPKIMCDVIANRFQSYMSDYQARCTNTMTQIADQKVRDVLRRTGY